MTGEDGVFDAIRFSQGVGANQGQQMYLLSAPAGWLVRRARVDQYDPKLPEEEWRRQGYQRALSEAHLKAIERYLRGTLKKATTRQVLPVFPTSVLLAVRSDVEFEPLGEKCAVAANPWVKAGRLRIPAGQELYVIDGQHRLEGLRRLLEEVEPEMRGWADYHLPVTIMVMKEKLHELLHFLVINKEAKNVRTDLAERLLDLVRTQNPELIRDERLRQLADERCGALAIVNFLETQPEQPWFGRVARPNERRKGEKVASEGQLSKSLRHICTSRPLNWSEEKLRQFVVDFWLVLEELLPKAFENPKQYTIQSSTGFGALHRVLPNLVSIYSDRKSMKEMLGTAAPFFTESAYWERGGETSQYSSEAGFKKHAERIKAALLDQLG